MQRFPNRKRFADLSPSVALNHIPGIYFRQISCRRSSLLWHTSIIWLLTLLPPSPYSCYICPFTTNRSSTPTASLFLLSMLSRSLFPYPFVLPNTFFCMLFPFPLSPSTLEFPLSLGRDYLHCSTIFSPLRPPAANPHNKDHIDVFHDLILRFFFDCLSTILFFAYYHYSISFFATPIPSAAVNLISASLSGFVFVCLLYSTLLPHSLWAIHYLLPPFLSVRPRTTSYCRYSIRDIHSRFQFSNPCRHCFCVYPPPPHARFQVLAFTGALTYEHSPHTAWIV